MRSSTSQAWATPCIQVPDSEITWPAKYNRKLGTLSDEKIRRRATPRDVISASRVAAPASSETTTLEKDPDRRGETLMPGEVAAGLRTLPGGDSGP